MDEKLNDDSSHYEISLTATQAFVAFVLLLLSLAAAFVFGILIGRGQLDGEIAKRQQQAQSTEITERPTVARDTAPTASVTEATPEPAAGVEAKKTPDVPFEIKPATTTAATQPKPAPAAAVAPAPAQADTAHPVTEAAGPAYAQLLATSDAKRAEALAAKLIDAGFTTAYVDRIKSDKGTIHRVRVRFKTDGDARAALPKLQPYASEKILVTKQ